MNASLQTSNDTPPLRTLNPAPQRAFEVRVTLDGAPGPFATASAVAQYDVTNEAECGQKDELAGVFLSITSNETVALKRVSDTEYAGVVYVDGIVDEDYYGRGVCHWALTEARVVLQAGKDAADTRFVADLPAASVLGQGSRTRYFWNGYYPRAEMAGFREFGNADLASAQGRQAEDQREAFFSVTLAAREMTP
ncbi:hypothetical protein [Stenotrophomonas sp.]|uniref:hypothetical protein n=1 Tax=Stenotrophomonas sp. TaxID=69392 RepID=UPI002FCA45B3